MKHYSELLAKIKKADTLFNLINDNDIIVVGVSGGKDSIVLFEALLDYKKYSKKTYTLIPVILDLGFPAFDAASYVKHFNARGYDLYISDSQAVAKILTIQQAEQHLPKLPCSICSKMKKAAINSVAVTLGANKVAFAHHVDDAVETLFMNMISGGRLATFKPQMYLDRAGITFIRPLILVEESLITKVQQAKTLPLLPYTCPNNKKTRREDMKQLLTALYNTYPSAKQNFQLMLMNENQTNLWDKNYETVLADNLVIKKATTKSLLSDVFFIRTSVFIIEQQISANDEYDSHEDDYTSYVLYVNNNRAATIRYTFDVKTRTVTIGRIAVLKAYRGHGYGKLLINYIEALLKGKYRPFTLYIGGQAYLRTYYESLGYVTDGKTYIDAGIEHFHFTKEVK